MIFNIINLHNADYFVNFAVSNINNILFYLIMKEIKKNFRNLTKVVKSIVDVPYSDGMFVCTILDKDLHYATLVSFGRNSLGSVILSHIPSNFHFRVSFNSFFTTLSIWYE